MRMIVCPFVPMILPTMILPLMPLLIVLHSRGSWRVGLLRKNGQRSWGIWLVVLEFEVNGRTVI
jgi:hypothetical protein